MPKFHIKLDLRDKYGPHQIEQWVDRATPLEAIRRQVSVARSTGDTVERITIDLKPERAAGPVSFE